MLVTEMRRACDRDHRSNEAAAPALERLKLCRQVEAAALEAEMRAPLLQEGLLVRGGGGGRSVILHATSSLDLPSSLPLLPFVSRRRSCVGGWS